jgi:hypothetical protein
MNDDTRVVLWLFFLSAIVTSMIGWLLYIHTTQERSLYIITGIKTYVDHGDSTDCEKYRYHNMDDHVMDTDTPLIGDDDERRALVCDTYTKKYRSTGIYRMLNTVDKSIRYVEEMTGYWYDTPELALSHVFSGDLTGTEEYFVIQTVNDDGSTGPDVMNQAFASAVVFRSHRHRLVISTAVFGGISVVLLLIFVVLLYRHGW